MKGIDPKQRQLEILMKAAIEISIASNRLYELLSQEEKEKVKAQ